MLAGHFQRGRFRIRIHDRQVEVGVGVVLIQQDASLEILFRLLGIPLLAESDREIIVGHGVSGIFFNDFLEDFDRLIEATLAAIHIRDIHGSKHIAGRKAERPFQSHLSGGEFSGVDLSDRQIGERKVVVWILVRELLVDFFRIGESAIAHEPRCFFHELARLGIEYLGPLRGITWGFEGFLRGFGNRHRDAHIHLAGIIQNDERIAKNQHLAVRELCGRL